VFYYQTIKIPIDILIKTLNVIFDKIIKVSPPPHHILYHLKKIPANSIKNIGGYLHKNLLMTYSSQKGQ
jgi:hypothetical protein